MKIGASCPLAVAAEGNVQVIPQPGGERYVPASPKLGKTLRDVGEVEIDRQLIAEEPGGADGDERVAGEVGKDLHGKSEEQGQQVDGGEIEEVGIGDPEGLGVEVVGNPHLQKVAQNEGAKGGFPGHIP